MVFRKGHSPWNKGKFLSEEHKEKMKNAKEIQRKLIKLREKHK